MARAILAKNGYIEKRELVSKNLIVRKSRFTFSGRRDVNIGYQGIRSTRWDAVKFKFRELGKYLQNYAVILRYCVQYLKLDSLQFG